MLEAGRWISMDGNECEALRLFVLSRGVLLLEVGRGISMGSNQCDTLWLFVLSCGVFLLEVGRGVSMGSNQCETLWLFVLSCGAFLLSVRTFISVHAISGVLSNNACVLAFSLCYGGSFLRREGDTGGWPGARYGPDPQRGLCQEAGRTWVPTDHLWPSHTMGQYLTCMEPAKGSEKSHLCRRYGKRTRLSS